jgi:transcriptional regulator
MYVPADFALADRDACHALIRQYGFAVLVTADQDGVPFATHLPLILDSARGENGTLIGHVARANPQGPALDGRPTLAIFQGPHAYISPTWYGTPKTSVPTWNYVAVHAYGVPRLVADRAEVHHLLVRMVESFEPPGPKSWRMADADPGFLDRMMRGVIAFEMPIDRLEGKAKLSQNRPVTDRPRIIAALEERGDPLAAAVAELMAARSREG